MQAIIQKFFMVTLLMASITAIHAQDAQKHSLKKIVQEIAAHNSYESARVGFAGVKSKQYIRFEKLVSLANNYELIGLAMDTNAVVRLYALQALHQKGVTLTEDLEKRFAEDKTQVFTLNGCIGGKQSVQLLASAILQQPVSAGNAFNTKEKETQ